MVDNSHLYEPFPAVIREWDDSLSKVMVTPLGTYVIVLTREVPHLRWEGDMGIEYEDGTCHRVLVEYFDSVRTRYGWPKEVE